MYIVLCLKINRTNNYILLFEIYVKLTQVDMPLESAWQIMYFLIPR